MLSLTDIHFEPAPRPPKSARSSGGLLTRRQSPRSACAEIELTTEWRGLLERSGLEVQAYKPALLNRRSAACLRKLGVSSPKMAADLVSRKPALLKELPNAFLLGVTSFFRDPQVWRDIESCVLPSVRTRPEVRILSAGCSEGHELFSMGMILAKHGLLHKSRLLGLDCRAGAIQKAQSGSYAAAVLKEVPTDYWKYFEDCGATVRVSRDLRSAAEWKVANILHPLELGGCDVALFRNVSIYLNEQVAFNIWAGLTRSLIPGGFLITGKAEKPPRELGLTGVASCIYKKALVTL